MALSQWFYFLQSYAWAHLQELARFWVTLGSLFAASLGSNDYTYNPIEQNEIRLLEILPSDSYDTPITCRLHAAPLDPSPPLYVAISYAWGDQNVKRVGIVCDGRRALVTPILSSIVVRLRELKIRRVWGDALCIKQGSDEKALSERNKQVALMGRVFESAEKVIVDLGELCESEEVFWEKPKIYQEIPFETWAVAAGLGTGHFLKIMTGVDSLGLPPRESPFWTAFVQFMQRPWFIRLWIVQEYALAKKIQIMLGCELHAQELLDSTIYRVFTHALHIVRFSSGPLDWKHQARMKEIYKLIRKPCGAMNTIVMLRRSKLAMAMTVGSKEWKAPFKQNLDFCELYDTTRMFNHTEWQDRVYGVLGLVCDAESIKESIPIDYQLDEEELSYCVSAYFINQGNGPYVLYNCRGQIAPKESSWALSLLRRPEFPLATLINPNGSCRNEV